AGCTRRRAPVAAPHAASSASTASRTPTSTISTSETRAWNWSAAGTVTWGPWSPPMQSTARVTSGLLALGADDFLAAVEARRADVVAQVRFAGGRLDRHRGCAQVVMRAVHAAARRRFLVLLDCHGEAPLWSMLALHHAAQAGKRRTCCPIASRLGCLVPRLALLVPRCVRKREDQLVLDEIAHRHLLAGEHAVR